MPTIRKLLKRPDPPSDDNRWKIINATMRRNGYSRNALIETLHTAQDCFGFLDETTLRYVAASLRVPVSAVQGVATFYHHFTMKPQGRHTCVICTGTACYIKGVPELLSHVKDKYKLRGGQTTEDGNISLMTARCLGTCSMAPAVVFDGEVRGEVEKTVLDNYFEEWGKS